MTKPTIDQLPTPPSRANAPDEFSARADAFVSALPKFVNDTNEVADFVELKTDESIAQVALATDQAVRSEAAADSSQASAIQSELSKDIGLAASNFQGDYDQSVQYNKGQSVLFNNVVYIAINDVIGQQPDISSSFFQITTSNNLTNNNENFDFNSNFQEFTFTGDTQNVGVINAGSNRDLTVIFNNDDNALSGLNFDAPPTVKVEPIGNFDFETTYKFIDNGNHLLTHNITQTGGGGFSVTHRYFVESKLFKLSKPFSLENPSLVDEGQFTPSAYSLDGLKGTYIDPNFDSGSASGRGLIYVLTLAEPFNPNSVIDTQTYPFPNRHNNSSTRSYLGGFATGDGTRLLMQVVQTASNVSNFRQFTDTFRIDDYDYSSPIFLGQSDFVQGQSGNFRQKITRWSRYPSIAGRFFNGVTEYNNLDEPIPFDENKTGPFPTGTQSLVENGSFLAIKTSNDLFLFSTIINPTLVIDGLQEPLTLKTIAGKASLRLILADNQLIVLDGQNNDQKLFLGSQEVFDFDNNGNLIASVGLQVENLLINNTDVLATLNDLIQRVEQLENNS